MADLALQTWTVAQFFEWQARQAERYELVNGVPVRVVAGARNVHDDIVVNLLAGPIRLADQPVAELP